MNRTTGAVPPSTQDEHGESRRFGWFAAFLFLLHAALMLVRYGQLPLTPMLGDEIIINDAAISLGTGHGYAATSFAGSHYGIDKLFAHFPPLYPLTASLAFRLFGVSVYSLRLTTTLMSIAACAVFLYLLMRLCRANLLSWSAACLAGAIYCTFTPLIVLERAARMESMIEFLALLSFAAILNAVEAAGNGRRYWLVTAGVLAGLCAAVHPEAVTVMLLLGLMALLIVPGEPGAKAVSVLAAMVTPIVVCLVTFGRESGAAWRQFSDILHHQTPAGQGIVAWLPTIVGSPNISAMNMNLALFAIVLLVLLLPIAYLFSARKLPASNLGRRISRCFAIVALVELAVMQWGLHADIRRYMFLFGLLLIGLSLAAVGNRPLHRWQSVLGSLLVVAQLCAAAVYFYPFPNRGDRMNANRFMPIVDSVPKGVSVLTSQSPWLDFRERGTPIELLYYAFDGEKKWKSESAHPFQRFDVIVLDEADGTLATVPEEEAAQDRVKRVYRIGGDTIDVYQRNPVQNAH